MTENKGSMSEVTGYNSPLVPGAARFPVGAPRDDRNGACLSPPAKRAFLLCYAEPLQMGKHDKTGATPPETTGSDGKKSGDDDYTAPDYEP